jgi:hypothetical protein
VSAIICKLLEEKYHGGTHRSKRNVMKREQGALEMAMMVMEYMHHFQLTALRRQTIRWLSRYNGNGVAWAILIRPGVVVSGK